MEVLLIFLGAIAVIVLWYFVAAEFRRIAAMKGHDEARYFWWTFLVGPVGMLMVIALPQATSAEPISKAKEKQAKSAEPEEKNGKMFICTACGNRHTGWYQKCPHCGATGKMIILDSMTATSQDTALSSISKAVAVAESSKPAPAGNERPKTAAKNAKFECSVCKQKTSIYYETCPYCNSKNTLEPLKL